MSGRSAGLRRWGVTKRVAVGWFPPGELEKALAMWPFLLAGWQVANHVEYCRVVDRHLRELDVPPDSAVLLAPIQVKHFVKWCGREGLDPAAHETRSTYAMEVAARGRGRQWPPSPGKGCWCGRNAAYEDCCGA